MDEQRQAPWPPGREPLPAEKSNPLRAVRLLELSPGGLDPRCGSRPQSWPTGRRRTRQGNPTAIGGTRVRIPHGAPPLDVSKAPPDCPRSVGHPLTLAGPFGRRGR